MQSKRHRPFFVETTSFWIVYWNKFACTLNSCVCQIRCKIWCVCVVRFPNVRCGTFVLQVVKARVKDLCLNRYKIVCVVHVGENKNQSVRLGSRCLLDPAFDSFTTYEYRNQHVYAVGTVYGLYSD